MADRSITVRCLHQIRALIREAREPGTGKSMHREALKPQPDPLAPIDHIHHYPDTRTFDLHTRARFARDRFVGSDRMQIVTAPHAVGDRLWVREAWQAWAEFNGTRNDDLPVEMRARLNYPDDGNVWDARRRPATSAPRWASRLTLIVTEVRVERLQSAKGIDLIAEGLRCEGCFDCGFSACQDRGCFALRNDFRDHWNSLYGPDAWQADPWVSVTRFRPILANIDALAQAEPSQGREAMR